MYEMYSTCVCLEARRVRAYTNLVPFCLGSRRVYLLPPLARGATVLNNLLVVSMFLYTIPCRNPTIFVLWYLTTVAPTVVLSTSCRSSFFLHGAPPPMVACHRFFISLPVSSFPFYVTSCLPGHFGPRA